MPPKPAEPVQESASTPDEGNHDNISISSILSNRNVQKAALLTILAAAYSPISLNSLSPVYGSIPSNLFHRHGMMAGLTLAYIARVKFGQYFPRDIAAYVPVFAFWIPTIQYVLFKQSGFLGNPLGPFTTEALTYFPLVAMGNYSAATLLESVDLSALGEDLAEIIPGVAIYLLFTAAEKLAKVYIGSLVGLHFSVSRVGLQLLVASYYALVLPSTFLWAAVPSIAFNLGFNTHLPLGRNTGILNASLAQYNYTLLERKESLTGYISVIEDTSQHLRLMRCDHSLLGGEWTNTPRPEPIFAIFAMLEAVRLVEPDERQSHKEDAESKALTIGLGIGTTPGALVMHGIPTTIVEIDPVVYDFALKYFDLPSNHTPVIADALSYVDDVRTAGNTRFDYIVHDVFTGGAEPVELFTLEFMKGLSALLEEDGVIAINYAGDIAAPSAKMIIYTIRTVFPTCRIFRESAPPPTLNFVTSDPEPDFTNMVIFCKKSSGTPLKFREPVEADFLKSSARKSFLYPRYEVPDSAYVIRGGPEQVEKMILKTGKTKQLEKLHMKSAVGHWKLMRSVIPAKVWENW